MKCTDISSERARLGRSNVRITAARVFSNVLDYAWLAAAGDGRTPLGGNGAMRFWRTVKRHKCRAPSVGASSRCGLFEPAHSGRGPRTRTSTKGLLAKMVLIGLVICSSEGAAPAEPTKPQRGGTLELGLPVDWRSLDPARAFDADSAPLQKLLFRGLIDFGDGIDLVPDQASDWKISPDGKVYTFHLRPGVRFSNGREVEAEDYVFSFERMLDPKTSSTGQTYLLGILGATEFNQGKSVHVAGLRAPDPHTFVIELKEPQFTFRYVLAMNFCDVLPRDVVQKYGDDFQYHLTGSGPYYIKEWRRNISYRFERNPYYTGADGYVDAVNITIGGDTALMAMMLQRGEIDWARASLPDYVRFERDPKLRSWTQLVDTANTDYFFMNTEVKPFDNVQVRRAISHAINSERMARLAGKYNLPSREIIPPAMPWSNPGLPRYDYNPAKAREMLREAGYPDGFKTQLWHILSREDDGRVAQGIQEELRAIGVQVEIRQATYIAFQLKAEARREVPCGIWGWMEDYPDASDFLDVLLNGERITDTDCNNTSFYNNPAVNRLIDQGNESNDAGQRTQFYREAEKLIMADAPWVPILHERIPMMKHPRLHGATEHPVWLWRYQFMWLEQPAKQRDGGG